MKKLLTLALSLLTLLSSNHIFTAAAPRDAYKEDESRTAPGAYTVNIIFHGHNFLTATDKNLLTDAVFQAITASSIQVRSKSDNTTRSSSLEGAADDTPYAILHQHHLNRFKLICQNLTSDVIRETASHQFSCIATHNHDSQAITLKIYNYTTQTDMQLKISEGVIDSEISTQASEALDSEALDNIVFCFPLKLNQDSVLQDLRDQLDKFKIRVAYGPRTEKQQHALQGTKKIAVSDFTDKIKDGRTFEILPTTLGITCKTDTTQDSTCTITVETEFDFPSLRNLLQKETYRPLLQNIIAKAAELKGTSSTSTLLISFMCLVTPKLHYETLSKPFAVRLQPYGATYQVVMETEPDFNDKEVLIADADEELLETLAVQPAPINGKLIQSPTQTSASSAAGAPAPHKEEPDDSWL